jgi:hypothetical protein
VARCGAFSRKVPPRCQLSNQTSASTSSGPPDAAPARRRAEMEPSGLTFRRSRAQFGANFLCTFLELERLLGDAEQCEHLTLQIRELGVEDLHGVAVLGQCVPLYEAEQT